MTDDLPESIIIAGAGAIGVEFAYVMANYGVEVTIVEFLDRMVPLEEPEVSAELAKAYKKLGVTVLTGTKVETIDDSGDKVKVTVSPAKGGEHEGARGRQGDAGDRLRPADRGLRPGQDRRRAHRARRDRHRRLHAHQRAAHLRDRRLHGEADAGPHGRGAGRRRGGDHRRRGDHADRLRHDPAGDLLPAADRLVRLHRGAGQGQGLRRQDRQVPVHRQRQGARARRSDRLREAGRRRQVRRDPRRCT